MYRYLLVGFGFGPFLAFGATITRKGTVPYRRYLHSCFLFQGSTELSTTERAILEDKTKHDAEPTPAAAGVSTPPADPLKKRGRVGKAK